jgi:hypothetical protein
MLPLLPADKANHALYGGVAAVLGALGAPLVGLRPHQGALVLCLALALAKEAYDRHTGRGNAELADVVATLAGGVPVFLLAWRLQP